MTDDDSDFGTSYERSSGGDISGFADEIDAAVDDDDYLGSLRASDEFWHSELFKYLELRRRQQIREQEDVDRQQELDEYLERHARELTKQDADFLTLLSDSLDNYNGRVEVLANLLKPDLPGSLLDLVTGLLAQDTSDINAAIDNIFFALIGLCLKVYIGTHIPHLDLLATGGEPAASSHEAGLIVQRNLEDEQTRPVDLKAELQKELSEPTDKATLAKRAFKVVNKWAARLAHDRGWRFAKIMTELDDVLLNIDDAKEDQQRLIDGIRYLIDAGGPDFAQALAEPLRAYFDVAVLADQNGAIDDRSCGICYRQNCQNPDHRVTRKDRPSIARNALAAVRDGGLPKN